MRWLLLALTCAMAACATPETVPEAEPAPTIEPAEPPEAAEAAEPIRVVEQVDRGAPQAAEVTLRQQRFDSVHLTRFADGDGPVRLKDGFHLLDTARTPGQSNAIAFDREHEGARESTTLRCKLRVLEGGDGGAIAFLSTREYGVRGPAQFVRNWAEPNLQKSFAVGIDVHNPKNEEPFGPWGNYQGLPEREISLHWDGREIVKRVAPAEFRGDFADCEVTVQHVSGGADVTVRLAGEAVYDRYFVPGLLPYESRLAFGAGTREKATTEFDVRDIAFEAGAQAPPLREPKRVQVFNHVLTNNSKTAYESTVTLPPANWAFERVILTLEIHDAGPDWDEWDRNGELSVFVDGEKRGIVPFITSYRTPCHWQVDVTHFRPWLTGETRFEIRAGTTFYKNRGYMMSVSLDFHHGEPELEPYDVVPLWIGTARYKEDRFRAFFQPRVARVGLAAEAGRIFVTTTGHSQVGEFTPSKRTLVFRGDGEAGAETGQRFENLLWKADCYLNPNRPQFGTWKYSRAGWAPGDVVRPWWIDVTEHLRPGRTAEIRYEPESYDFSEYPENRRPTDKQANEASHVVRSYLILYRRPGALMAAPTLLVRNVVGGTQAAKAGMKRGDYIASYDGKPLASIADLSAAVQAAAGDRRLVVVYRGAERLEMEFGPGKLGVNLAER